MPRTSHPLLALLPAFLISVAPVSAQESGQTEDTVQLDMATIEQAYRDNNFVLVRKGLAELAKDDTNALAHFRYGRVLLSGLGGPADRPQAVVWLQKAVSQNSVDAATLLARVYLSAGEFYDAEAAAKLLSNAAARGNEEAQYRLGMLYVKGQGVAQDDEAAFSWLLAASEGGYSKAKLELSKAYSRGRGTNENVAEAFRWLEEAAHDGETDAQYFLANALENGPEKYRSPGSAFDWYLRAAENGHVLAQRSLGTKYLKGAGAIKPNAEEALRWLTAAADADDAGAMQNLALGYLQGDVLPQNDKLAAHWFKIGSRYGLGRSSLGLGAMYQAGRGVPESLEEAVTFYRLAVEQGEKDAALRLASMAIDGTLLNAMAPHDVAPFVHLELLESKSPDALDWLKTQASAGLRPAQELLGRWYIEDANQVRDGVPLLEAAANAGSVRAQGFLGSLYSTGEGVELDYVLAHKWLNIAAASGDADAEETRNLINELMTPEQVAEAQAAARIFFETVEERTPQTDQVVSTFDNADDTVREGE